MHRALGFDDPIGKTFRLWNKDYTIIGVTKDMISNSPYDKVQPAVFLGHGGHSVDIIRIKPGTPIRTALTAIEAAQAIASDLAVGYEIAGDGTLDDQTAAREAREGRGYKVPNGAIFTTVDDLARFVTFELSRGPDNVLAHAVLDESVGGVADEPVHVVACDELAAVVGVVNLDEFGQDALRRNLEDLDWVAQKARAHDAVISTIAQSGAVIPVRMATVYLDDGRVQKLLESRREDFGETLGRLSGRTEVGVKVYADPTRLLTPDAEQDDDGSRTGTSPNLMGRVPAAD